MSKPLCVFQSPIWTRSGYGDWAEAIAKSLLRYDKFDLMLVPTRWGHCSKKNLQADLAKDLWARVEDCLTQGLMNPDSNQQALATFSRLDFLTEDAQVDISNTPNTRKFVRTIPLHVKLL